MPYIAWNHPSVEHVPADEAATIAKGSSSLNPGMIADFLAQSVVEQINFIQGAQACPRGGHHVTSDPSPFTFTGTHAKTHGIVKGELTVSNEIPAAFKQSLFADAGTYPLIMRCKLL